MLSFIAYSLCRSVFVGLGVSKDECLWSIFRPISSERTRGGGECRGVTVWTVGYVFNKKHLWTAVTSFTGPITISESLERNLSDDVCLFWACFWMVFFKLWGVSNLRFEHTIRTGCYQKTLSQNPLNLILDQNLCNYMYAWTLVHYKLQDQSTPLPLVLNDCVLRVLLFSPQVVTLLPKNDYCEWSHHTQRMCCRCSNSHHTQGPTILAKSRDIWSWKVTSGSGCIYSIYNVWVYITVHVCIIIYSHYTVYRIARNFRGTYISWNGL